MGLKVEGSRLSLPIALRALYQRSCGLSSPVAKRRESLRQPLFSRRLVLLFCFVLVAASSLASLYDTQEL